MRVIGCDDLNFETVTRGEDRLSLHEVVTVSKDDRLTSVHADEVETHGIVKGVSSSHLHVFSRRLGEKGKSRRRKSGPVILLHDINRSCP